MTCDNIRNALIAYGSCEETSEGARIPTHCLYPSFDVVHVYVVKFGDGYKVHDSCGAFRSAWEHGRDAPSITRFLYREAARYRLEVKDHAVVADVPSLEWLASGILAVSNASASAANSAVEHFVSAAEDDLVARIYEVLISTFNTKYVSKEFLSRGRSGKEYRFDFGIRGQNEDLILINAVSPHPASISAKYVSFADGGPNAMAKLAVHDRPLDAGDISLLQQVAEIVPFRSLAPGVQRALSHA